MKAGTITPLLLVWCSFPRNGSSLSLSPSPATKLSKVFSSDSPRRSQSHRQLEEEISSPITTQSQHPPPPIVGDPACRCASQSDLPAIGEHNLPSGSPLQDVNLETFGFGCHAHDQESEMCRVNAECDSNDDACQLSNTKPLSCSREWCWVLPSQCTLLHRLYPEFVNTTLREARFYSYAACRNEDTKHISFLLDALENKTLRMGFFHQAGGYGGAYNRDGVSFQGPLENWYGGTVLYVVETARQGKFNINITAPPDFLANRSKAFGTGPNDLCVYATALGYLDMCVSIFIVTNLRATLCDWIVLRTGNIRLITPVIQEDEGEKDSLLHNQYTATLFLPFKPYCWLFIVVFVVPVLAGIFLLHDYGQAGSRFPADERLFYSAPQNSSVVADSDNEYHKMEIRDRNIRSWGYLPRVIYTATLGIFAREFTFPIISPGAKIHLLGWCFFILTLLSVYTANLAAILTERHSNAPVRSLEDVLQQRLRICAIRQVYEIVSTVHNIPEKAFVVDPVEIGGDGRPGFLCCSAQQRVMSSIDPSKADTDPRYCHVGLGFEQDVTTFHGFGLACNVHMVGSKVGSIQFGLPLAASYSSPLQALMLSMKNDGWVEKVLALSKPPSRCSDTTTVTEEGDNYALNVEQLSGVWVVTGGFAFFGLCFTLCARMTSLYRKKRSLGRFKPVLRYDQYGERINRLEDL